MEKKYLLRDEDAFKQLLELIYPQRTSEEIAGYSLGTFSSKEREYRYFDTFDGDILNVVQSAQRGTLERSRVSLSARSREEDYILTVKLPTRNLEERDQKELRIPSSDTPFHTLEPKDFINVWPPMRKVMELCGYKPLQEVVRLAVWTNRVDLYKDSARIAEIAVDNVEGKMPFAFFDPKKFYELEIEQKEKGIPEDVEKIGEYFLGQHPTPQLIPSSLPKWVKALKLMRGEEIISDSD